MQWSIVRWTVGSADSDPCNFEGQSLVLSMDRQAATEEAVRNARGRSSSAKASTECRSSDEFLIASQPWKAVSEAFSSANTKNFAQVKFVFGNEARFEREKLSAKNSLHISQLTSCMSGGAEVLCMPC